MAENSTQTQSTSSNSGGGGYQTSAILGSAILSGLSSSHAVKRAIKWERERATHAHQWEVADLKAAGLNPILSAGGTGALTGGIETTNTMEPVAEGINNAMQHYISAKTLQMAEKKNNAEIDNINANTARTLALMPEEIKTHEWNRQPHAVREFGGTALAVSEIIDELATRSRNSFNKESKEETYYKLKHREPKD